MTRMGYWPLESYLFPVTNGTDVTNGTYMPRLASLIDVAPDPVTIGVALAVVIFVIAAVVVLAGALVFFLWYRKRRLRHREMIRPDNPPRLDPVQANQPNQP